jgi:hypothetical protein
MLKPMRETNVFMIFALSSLSGKSESLPAQTVTSTPPMCRKATFTLFQNSCRMRTVIIGEAIGKRRARQREWRIRFLSGSPRPPETPAFAEDSDRLPTHLA